MRDLHVPPGPGLPEGLVVLGQVADGYGVFMTYNLPGGDKSAYVSAMTQKLYGQAATYH